MEDPGEEPDKKPLNYCSNVKSYRTMVRVNGESDLELHEDEDELHTLERVIMA